MLAYLLVEADMFSVIHIMDWKKEKKQHYFLILFATVLIS